MRKSVGVYILLFAVGAAVGAGCLALWSAARPGGAKPFAQGAAVRSGGAFAEVVGAVSPSVVNISTVKVHTAGDAMREDPFYDFFNDFFSPLYEDGASRRLREQSMGSGVVVSPDGFILTNYHVVKGAEKIRVTLYDRRSYGAAVVGADPKTDIAVLRVSATGLPTVPWGDSEGLQVGDFVLAFGNPFGLSHTVTMGIISAVGRANVGIADFEDFIQTDAAINPGNSGGPLINARGEIVGLSTAIFSRSGGYQGIGFAVPSNMLRPVLEQLIAEGRIVRGWVGVSLQDLTPEMAGAFGHHSPGGALIAEVIAGSPAADAGLMAGDIVTEYDGKPVAESSTLRILVSRSRPGHVARMRVFRDGQGFEMTVPVKELPGGEEVEISTGIAEPGMGPTDVFSGLGVIALTRDIARQLNLGPADKGVVVASVADGSPAGEAGLRRGDVIEEVDRRLVRTLDEFKRLADSVRAEQTVLMYINRGGKRFFVTLGLS
jgi:serine protease Do